MNFAEFETLFYLSFPNTAGIVYNPQCSGTGMNEMRKFYPLTDPAFTYSVVCGKRQVKVYFSFKKNVNKQHRRSLFCVLKFVSHGLSSTFLWFKMLLRSQFSSLPADAADKVWTVRGTNADIQWMNPESWPEVFWPCVSAFPSFLSE